MGAPWVPFVSEIRVFLGKWCPSGTHEKTGKALTGAVSLGSGVSEKSMSGAFHGGDRGSNSLGDANITHRKDREVGKRRFRCICWSWHIGPPKGP